MVNLKSFKSYLRTSVKFSFFAFFSFLFLYFFYLFFRSFPDSLILLSSSLFKVHPFLIPFVLFIFSLLFVLFLFLYIRFLYLFFQEARVPFSSGTPVSSSGLGYRNLPLNFPSRHDSFPLVSEDSSEITNLSRVLDPVTLSDLTPYPHVPFHPEAFSDLQSLPGASTHFDFGKFFGFKDGLLTDYALEWAFVLQDRFTALEPQEVEWYYDLLREEMRMPMGYLSLLTRGLGILELQDELETEAEFEHEINLFQSTLPYSRMEQEGIGLALPVFDLDSLISLTDDANSLVLKRIRADRFLSYKASDYLSTDEARELRFKSRWKRWRWHPLLQFNAADMFGHFYINRSFVCYEKQNLLSYRRLRRFALAQIASNARLRRTLRSKPTLWTGFASLDQSAFIDLINIISPFHSSASPTHLVSLNRSVSPKRRSRPLIPFVPSSVFERDDGDQVFSLDAEFLSFYTNRIPRSLVYMVFGVSFFFSSSPQTLVNPTGLSFPKKKAFRLFPSSRDPYPFYTDTIQSDSSFIWAETDDFVIYWLPFIIAYCHDFIGFNLRRARFLRLDSAGRFISSVSSAPNDSRKSRFFKSVLKPILTDSSPLSESGSLSHFFRPAFSSNTRLSFAPWRFFFKIQLAKSVRNQFRSTLFLLGGRTLIGLNRERGSDLSALGDTDLRYYALFSRSSSANLHFSLSTYESRRNLVLLFSLRAWLNRFGFFSTPLTFRSFLFQLRPLFRSTPLAELLPHSVSDYFLLEIYCFHLTQLLGRCPTFLELLRHFFRSKKSRKSLFLSSHYILDRFFYRTSLRSHVLRSFLHPALRPCVEKFDSRAWKEIEPYSIASRKAYHGGWYRSPFWESSSASFFQEQFSREIKPDSVGLRYFETFCTTLDSDDYLSVQQLLFDRLARSQLSIVADGRPLEYNYDSKYFENFRRYYLCQEIFKPWYQAYWRWRIAFEEITKTVLYAHNYTVRAWTQSLPLAVEGFENPSQFSLSRSTLDGEPKTSPRPHVLSPIPTYEPNYVGRITGGGSFGRSRVLDLGFTSHDPFEDYLFDTLPLSVRPVPPLKEFHSIFDLSHFVSQTYAFRDLSFPFFSRGFSELPSPSPLLRLLSVLNSSPRSSIFAPLLGSLNNYALFAHFRSFTGFLPFWFFRSQSLFRNWYAPRFPRTVPSILTVSGQPITTYESALTKFFDSRSMFNAQDFSAYAIDGELFKALSLLPEAQWIQFFERQRKNNPLPDPEVEKRRRREEALDRHFTLLSYYFDIFGSTPLSQVTATTLPLPLASIDLNPLNPPLLLCAKTWCSIRGNSFPSKLFTKFVGPVFDSFRWLLGYPLSHGLNFPFIVSDRVHLFLLNHPDTKAVLDSFHLRRFNPDYRPSYLNSVSVTPQEYWTALKDLVLNSSLDPKRYPYSKFEFYWERLYASFFFHYRYYGTFPDWPYSDRFPSFPELESVRKIGTFLKEYSYRVRTFDPEMGLDPTENEKEPRSRPTLPSVPRLEEFGLESSYAARLYRRFDPVEKISLYGLQEVDEYSVSESRFVIFSNSPPLPLLNALLERYELPSPSEDIAHYLVDPAEYRYPARSIRWLQSVYQELQDPRRSPRPRSGDFDGYEEQIEEFFFDFKDFSPLPKQYISQFQEIPTTSFPPHNDYFLNQFRTLYFPLSKAPFARYYIERQKSHFQVLRPTLLFFRSDAFRPLVSYYAYRTNSQESEGGEYPFFFRNFLALDEADRYENQDEDMEDDEEDEEIEVILTEESQDSSEPDEFGDIEDVEELELEIGVDEPFVYRNTRVRFYDWILNPAVINDGFWDFDFSNRQRRHYRATLRHTTIGGLDEEEEHFASTVFYYRGNYDEYIYWEDDDIDEEDTEDDEQDTTHMDEESR